MICAASGNAPRRHPKPDRIDTDDGPAAVNVIECDRCAERFAVPADRLLIELPRHRFKP